MNKFEESYPGFSFLIEVGSIKATCKQCGDENTYPRAHLNRKIRLETQLVCKSDMCTPCPEIKGFINADNLCLLQCLECGLKYNHTKRTKNLTCYCKIKSKGFEHTLYKKLSKDPELLLSREEYFQNVKTDIVIKYNNRSFYIMIDKIKNFYDKSPVFEKELNFVKNFIEHRDDTQFMIRVLDLSITDEFEINKLLAYVKNEDLLSLKSFYSNTLQGYHKFL